MRKIRSVVSGVVAVALFCALPAIASDCASIVRDASSGAVNRLAVGVAWTGSTFGVVKTDSSFPGAIYFALYSEGLQPLTSDAKLVDATFAGVTAFLWNGSEFAVFYQQAFTSQLMLQRVSAAGAAIGVATPIAPNRGSSTDREYDIIWNAGRDAYLVANTVTRSQQNGLWLTTVNRDGSVRSDVLLTVSIAPTAAPRVAAADNGSVLAVFHQSDGLYYVEYDSNGALAGIGKLMPAVDAVVAANGKSFLVVGSVAGTPSMTMHWAYVDDHGKVTQADSLLFTPRGVETRPVSLAWNPTLAEWDLTYLDSLLGFTNLSGDYRLHRFAADGELFSDGYFSPEVLFANYATSLPFAWTGTQFVTAASRPLSPGRPTEAYLFSLCPLTASIVTNQSFAPVGARVAFAASVTGGTSVLSYTWDFGDSVRGETGQNIAHIFERIGDYTVTVRVVDTAGSSNIARRVIHIYAPKTRAVRGR